MNAKKIIIGTWPLSGDYGYINYKNVIKILEHSYRKGFKEYDTAPSYGNGSMEFVLGNLFFDKKDIKINSKVGNMPFGNKSFDLDSLKVSIDQSLKRLRRDTINILFLHNPRINSKTMDKCISFLDELKRNKVIKHSGISLAKNFKYDNKILKNFDIVQDDANLLSQEYKKISLNKNQKFFGRSPYASGILTGALNKKFEKDDHRSQWLNKTRAKIIEECLEAIKICSNYQMKYLAFLFVMSDCKISKNIFGIKSKEHVDDLFSLSKKKKPMNIKKILKKLEVIYEKKFFLKEKFYKYFY